MININECCDYAPGKFNDSAYGLDISGTYMLYFIWGLIRFDGILIPV